MPKLSQRGAIQYIILLILLLGIIGVVYLVTKGPLKIFPKASESESNTPTTAFILSPVKSQYAVGEEVVVTLQVRSDIAATNLYAAKISFDQQVLQFSRVDTTSSFITNWVERYWTDPGKISLVGGKIDPGLKTNTGDKENMAILYFKVLQPGSTSISFDADSAIYSNTDNINILFGKDSITLTLSTPVTPTVAPAATAEPTPAGETVTYTLQDGANLIGVPIRPSQTVGEVLNQTKNAQGQRICSEIKVKGVVDSGEGFLLPDDRAMTSRRAYLIRCSGQSTITLSGPAYTETDEQLKARLSAGNQWISLGLGASYSAEEFLQKVSSTVLDCTEVHRWGGGNWSGHFKTHSANNFQMNDKEGYDVKCQAPAGLVAGAGDGNANGDDRVDLADLSILLSAFNKVAGTPGFRGGVDLNGDRTINSFDFGLMRNLLIQKGVIRGSNPT